MTDVSVSFMLAFDELQIAGIILLARVVAHPSLISRYN